MDTPAATPVKSFRSDSFDSDESFELYATSAVQLPVMRHKIVSIEGNIGSGKTTLLSNMKIALKDVKNVIFLKEPVDEWETIKDKEGNTMLQKFYADQDRYSFPFQMMAYISRLALLRDTIKMHPTATIITERSLYTDKMVFAKMLHESGKIEDVNYQIYLKWFNSFNEECPVHQIVYVKTDPEICHARILKRSRAGEGGIPIEYLSDCHKYHEAMLDLESEHCVCENQLVIDGNVDIYDCNEAAAAMVASVRQFIGVPATANKLQSVETAFEPAVSV